MYNAIGNDEIFFSLLVYIGNVEMKIAKEGVLAILAGSFHPLSHVRIGQLHY